MSITEPARLWLGRTCATIALCVTLGVLGGCDGDGSIEIITPPEQMHGPRISGQVQLPDGDVTQAPTLWQRVYAMIVQPVQALFSESVEPVGAGVEAQLIYVDPTDIVDGRIPTDLPVLATASTNSNGQYEVFLPTNTTADRCRYMVQVGEAAAGTLTRAFVYRSTGAVDINFASEAVVRQILAALTDGLAEDLCDFESGDIAALYQAALDLPGTVTGSTIATVNANANALVSADPGFQAFLEDAAQPGPVPPTRTPTHTIPPVATVTFTPTRTRAATATETARPTRTEAPTASITPTASRTSTSGPTASPTSTAPLPTATNTVQATNTSGPPTATSTSVVVVPTNTVPPTSTSTVAVSTSTVPPATSTPTGAATGTATRIPTSTPTLPSGATLNLGSVSGAPGMIVSIPVMLVGTSIVAVSTDIEFDASLVDAVLVEGRPDCDASPALPVNKEVVTSLPSIPGLPAGHKVVRVGVLGRDNNDPLPLDTLLTCRFEINAAAPLGGVTLENNPAAADALGNPVPITGSDATITVTAVPASLDIEMVVATVGESFTISATLHSRGQAISAVSTDIAVGTAMLDVILGDDQTPDCIVDDAIGVGTTPNKRVFAALVPDEVALAAGGEGASTPVLRVGVIGTANNTAIPDGPVFHCQLEVPAETSPGSRALAHRPEGSSPTGTTIGLQGNPGQISIVQP